MTITFHGKGGKTFATKIPGIADRYVERARRDVEAKFGGLPVDPREGFPSFTVHNSKGEEVGGG